MSFYQLKKIQDIPANLDDIWQFISNPANLKTITPPSMGYDIITPGLPEKMYSGMIIEYRVKPILGIPTRWVTEITHVDEGKYFVDEQRIGPYKMWHHEHSIEEISGGIRMHDIISYQVPFGMIGRIVHWFMIRRQLENIFAYRKIAMEKLFGLYK